MGLEIIQIRESGTKDKVTKWVINKQRHKRLEIICQIEKNVRNEKGNKTEGNAGKKYHRVEEEEQIHQKTKTIFCIVFLLFP